MKYLRVSAEQQDDLVAICGVKLIQRGIDLARNGFDEEGVSSPAINNCPADVWIWYEFLAVLTSVPISPQKTFRILTRVNLSLWRAEELVYEVNSYLVSA